VSLEEHKRRERAQAIGDRCRRGGGVSPSRDFGTVLCAGESAQQDR
jgi:hypothetical protein